MKSLLWKIAFVVVTYILLTYGYNTLQPMIIADSAVLQLEDSDFAYNQFKGTQGLFKFYGVLYLLPLLVFIKKSKKNSKGE